MTKILTSLISFYKFFPQILLIGILFPFEGSCRYAPTCSNYAQEALQSYGVTKGLVLAVRRVARCHPWGGSGYDPVPANKARQKAKKHL
ncbi:MAG: membrane protein insertion efficiency factor YidD [Candidatus Levybacteria bacterium]|nr:membrane protein insertion efficiency factor YidD [Candidatus Levybacteria bacterium]